jgi:ABC-type bacteriocin/lantibiotic exporter with double-glycine peptidase domain
MTVIPISIVMVIITLFIIIVFLMVNAIKQDVRRYSNKVEMYIDSNEEMRTIILDILKIKKHEKK